MLIPFYPIKDQFIESFCAMDVATINLILETDRKFCNIPKHEFVATLSRIFNYLKLLGDTILNIMMLVAFLIVVVIVIKMY